MPGKGDYGEGATAGAGQYYPGSLEWKAWDAGARYRFSGAAAAVPITNNPFDQTGRPKEYQAWRDGWNEANSGNIATRRMPHIFGTPPA